MGDNGRRRVMEKYNWEAEARRLVGMYAAFVGRDRRKRQDEKNQRAWTRATARVGESEGKPRNVWACGFVGDYSCDQLAKMTRVLTHRGPDDSGVFWTPVRHGSAAVGLGSRRLAILDLSPAGHMPMTTPDGSCTIVYNGEIYNYAALRQHLEGKGYRFRSHSDTEAILYLYQEYGPDCVKRLNGMFAIAIWDAGARRAVPGARSLRHQAALLHDARRRLQLRLGGEVAAPAARTSASRSIREALHQYLTFLWVPDPRPMFAGRRKLPAGHWATWRNGALEIQEYWDLTFPDADHTFTGSEAALADEVRERFFAAARAQLQSDVPLGAFLSAGLDSTAIVAAVAGATAEPLRTFTIAFPERHRVGETTLDDTRVAARTAAHFGCRHTEIVVEPDVVDLLPKLVWHMDEPVADPAAVTAYMVCQEARRDVTVLLSGVGGDEVFAGYRRHAGHYLAERYRRLPAALRTRLIEPAVLGLPSLRGTPLKGWVRLAKKMARSGSLPPEDGFITHFVYLSDDQKRSLYAPACGPRRAASIRGSVIVSTSTACAHADFLNQMLYVDTQGVHGQPEPDLQRQDEHGLFGRSARPVPRLGVRGLVRVEHPAADEAQGRHHEMDPAAGDAR